MTSRVFLMLGLVLGLSACASGGPVTRQDQQFSVATQGRAAPALATPLSVTDVRIDVPADLRASEANMFYPIADIVWRGEPAGDRHAQVRAIFADAAERGTQGMTKGRKVVAEIAVTRFHSVTEKTRYTIGGTHSMRFLLTLRDAASGEIIAAPRKVVADTKAAGGAQAMAEEQAGRTQRVVVVERLAEVIRAELSQTPPLAQVSRGPADPAALPAR